MTSSSESISQHEQMALVRDRFTRTAGVFADYVLNQRVFEAERLLRLVAPGGSERALDVACGPGTLARIFAPHVRWIGGLDLTPAMLERARREAAERKLANFCAIRGNVLQTPFYDQSFDLVVTSYSIHHLPDAAAGLGEVARILKRGGRFGMLDMIVSENPAIARACNDIEIARDASHTRTLPLSEFERLLASFGLGIRAREIIEHPRTFDQWMRTAGSKRGDAEYEATRNLLEASMPNDTAGLRARFLDEPPQDAADARPDIELIHTALYLTAEKQ
ncbi:MAG: methyltransferase domain-containing protein [Candidatus Acidiferrales bacterium]